MNLFQKIQTSIVTHKKTAACAVIVLIVAVILIVRAATSSTKAATSYVLGTAETGTIVSTVSGTGQVSTASTLAITPQVSGTLTDIKVSPGSPVKKGQFLFAIDSTDAQKTLRDAKLSLASAKLALASFQVSTENSKNSQSTSVANAYNALLNSSPEAVAADLNTSSYASPSISGNYTLGKEGTITISTYSSEGGMSFSVSGLVESVGTVSSVTPQPIGNSGLLVTFPAKIGSGLSWNIVLPNKNSANYISNYNAYQQALQTQAETNASNGVTDIDLQTKQLAVTQAENSLTDAENQLAKYFITAPFDGTLASVPVTIGQQVSSGTTLGTLITTQQVATIPLNEVDAAKVTLGQKATMTFDAVSDLTITGKIVQVDTLGTVTQGVVNYNVKIAFDTEDARVKSGMSVSASIATDIAQDVITVPSSAVKGSGDSAYVLTATSATDPAPVKVPVTTGISDDANTEIKSGLAEGQQIVTRTVTATAATATAAPSILNSIGGTRAGGGGAMRTGTTGR